MALESQKISIGSPPFLGACLEGLGEYRSYLLRFSFDCSFKELVHFFKMTQWCQWHHQVLTLRFQWHRWVQLTSINDTTHFSPGSVPYTAKKFWLSIVNETNKFWLYQCQWDHRIMTASWKSTRIFLFFCQNCFSLDFSMSVCVYAGVCFTVMSLFDSVSKNMSLSVSATMSVSITLMSLT